MLAVRLHKKKDPTLSKGNFLVPIISWDTSRQNIRYWVEFLNDPKRKRRRNAPVRYLTLVKIPNAHPVFLAVDWIDKLLDEVRFAPLHSISDTVKHEIGQPSNALPEMILGAPLPHSCVKWTRPIESIPECNLSHHYMQGKGNERYE